MNKNHDVCEEKLKRANELQLLSDECFEKGDKEKAMEYLREAMKLSNEVADCANAQIKEMLAQLEDGGE